mmetsp:Transcript_104965/g.146353  ORF Transcript_104965/g.146353 Transcript_104965/m.146353 type:complete len:207 (+) Transcript_104965:54-674(+)
MRELYRPELAKRRNSSRVRGSIRNEPSMLDVTVDVVVFSTPLMTMHMCLASMTTPTPDGCSVSMRDCAISVVRRSCTCNRRAYTSTIRASLDNPRILPLGMYPICTFPKNGTRWCSQREWTSMSRTTTIESCFSWNTASFKTFSTLSVYPFVKNRRALAQRSGVLRRPSRLGSSPIHLRSSTHAAAIRFLRSSRSASAFGSAETIA